MHFLIHFCRQRLLASILCAAWGVAAGAPAIGAAAAAEVHTEQVRAELLVHAPDGVAPGKPLWLGLRLQHQPHWHTYWKNPGDSGLPTELQWTLPTGLTAGDIAWPAPRKIAIGTLANLGYEGDVLLPVPVQVDSRWNPGATQTLEVGLQATWLVCREVCIPQSGEFRVRIPAQGSWALHAAQFAAAQAARPVAGGGTVEAAATADGLRLRARKLPAAWVGHAIQALPESADVLATAALPSEGGPLVQGAPQVSQQGWDGDTWQALIPYAPQRSTAPAELAWVLSLGSTHLRAQGPVTGAWPALPEPAAVPPALQAALDANARTALAPSETLDRMAWMVLAALVGGLILNLMPCVFPVLALKVLAFAAQGGQSRAQQRAQGLAYTAGVVLSFVALGGLLLALRAGGAQLGWGFQLQSPAALIALAVLFTVLALNLAGWLHMGQVLPPGLAGMRLRQPVAEAFLSGLLAVAIASPCTAPFMGAALGYAMTLGGPESLVLFAALGVGLALPYLVASWVPGVGRLLPRPGAWMQTLQQFLAFPMAATVIWLVWVLGHVSGVDAAASTLVLLLSGGLLLWALRQTGRARWGWTGVALALCTAAAVGTWQLAVSAPSATDTPALGEGSEGSKGREDPGGRGLWQAWSEPTVQAALREGQAVFVDFTAAWCITCQVNKQTTLRDPQVEAAFAQRQVRLLRADWTRRDPAITQALQALGRSGVPVYVLYAPGKAPQVLTEILTPGEVLAALDTLGP